MTIRGRHESAPAARRHPERRRRRLQPAHGGGRSGDRRRDALAPRDARRFRARAPRPGRERGRRQPARRVRERRRRGGVRRRRAGRAGAPRGRTCPPTSRLQFRIGVHLGDLVIDDDEIFGDGINIAARLEALAEPGGVCASAGRRRSGARQGRRVLRGHRRSDAQEHPAAGARLSAAAARRAAQAAGERDHRTGLRRPAGDRDPAVRASRRRRRAERSSPTASSRT